MKPTKLLLMLTAVICLFVCSCSEDDDLSVANVVYINDNGEASNGADFVAIDSATIYLDHIQYKLSPSEINTVPRNYMFVTGYDKDKFTGNESIVSLMSYKGKTYTTFGIDYGAFNDCKKLTKIVIPDSLRFVHGDSFQKCTELVSIIVSPANPYLDSRNNCNGVIDTKKNELICGCKTTVIPNSVVSIGQGAFFGCNALTSLEIPNSVTSIGVFAYGLCEGLTEIEIPNSVRKIGASAFSSCRNVTTITIGENVEEIGVHAFDTHSFIKSIHCKAMTPPLCMSGNNPPVWDRVFDLNAYYSATLYIPKGTKDAYKKSLNYYKTYSDWGLFDNIVEE